MIEVTGYIVYNEAVVLIVEFIFLTCWY